MKKPVADCDDLYLWLYTHWVLMIRYFKMSASGFSIPQEYLWGDSSVVDCALSPCLRHYGIAFYNYNPLAGGYLTDRYHRDDKDENVERGSRFDPNKWQGKMYRMRYWNEGYFDALDLLRPVAMTHRLTEAECALRWRTHHSLLRKEFGDAIIIGASSVAHVEQKMVDFGERSVTGRCAEGIG